MTKRSIQLDAMRGRESKNKETSVSLATVIFNLFCEDNVLMLFKDVIVSQR